MVVCRIYLYKNAQNIISLFYYNLSMLSYAECTEIRKNIFVEGCKKLIDHISIDTSVLHF